MLFPLRHIESQLMPWSSGDKPLKEALILMNNEGVTSLAVVDNNYNVVGNISNVDVKVSDMNPNMSTKALY